MIEQTGDLIERTILNGFGPSALRGISLANGFGARPVDVYSANVMTKMDAKTLSEPMKIARAAGFRR